MVYPETMPIMRWALTFKKIAMRLKKGVHLITVLSIFITVEQMASIFLNPEADRNLFFVAIMSFCVTIGWISLMHFMDIDGMARVYSTFCWPLDRTGPETLKLILERAAFENKKALLAALLLPINVWLNVCDVTSLRRVDYVATLLRKHWPQIEMVYVALLIGWGVAASPVIIAFPFALIHSNWLQQYQTILFASYVKDAFAIHSFQNGASVNNERYQRIVWERLKFAVKRHTEILRTFRLRSDLLSLKLTSLFVGLFGGAPAITACFYIVAKQRIMLSSQMFLLMIVLLEMMTSTIQSYEDSHDAIFNAALAAPWYEWNPRNKQAYLLMMQLSAQLTPYKFLNVRVNRAFQIKFMEKAYAAGTILIKMK